MKSNGSPGEAAKSPLLSFIDHQKSSSAQSSRFHSLATMNPRLFAEEFDLLKELAENREEYQKDEVQLTIHRFPSSLLTPIDQTRVRVPVPISANKPGRNPTIVCLLGYGLSILSKDTSLKNLRELKRELSEEGEDRRESRLSSDYADLIDTIAAVFEKFQVSISDSVISEPRRQSVHLSRKLKDALFSFKSDLGINFDSLAVLCIQSALCEQEWILEEKRDEMRRNVERFLKIAKIRCRVLRNLMEELEK